MKSSKSIIPTMLSLLILVSLACSILGGIVPDEESLAATVQSAATQALNLATEIQSEDLVSTAQALVTEVTEGDLQATAEAFAGEIDADSIVATANAVATQAVAQGGEIAGTAQAMATQVSETSGEVPDDIPMPEIEPEDLFASSNLVSYSVALPFDDMLAFYQTEMPANGWTEKKDDTVVSPNAAVLVYQQIGKTVTITIAGIPLTETTLVQMIITEN